MSNLATIRPERNGDKGSETVLGKSCNVQPKLTAVILVGFFYDVGVWMLVDGMVWFICEVVLMSMTRATTAA